jgi:hypothetical protein
LFKDGLHVVPITRATNGLLAQVAQKLRGRSRRHIGDVKSRGPIVHSFSYGAANGKLAQIKAILDS